MAAAALRIFALVALAWPLASSGLGRSSNQAPAVEERMAICRRWLPELAGVLRGLNRWPQFGRSLQQQALPPEVREVGRIAVAPPFPNRLLLS